MAPNRQINRDRRTTYPSVTTYFRSSRPFRVPRAIQSKSRKTRSPSLVTRPSRASLSKVPRAPRSKPCKPRSPAPTTQPPRALLCGVPREIRQLIYHYMLRDTQIHVQYHPKRSEPVTWRPCQSSPHYSGLCANLPWPKIHLSRDDKSSTQDQRPDTLALMRTCRGIYNEIKAIVFEEAVLCVDMDQFHDLEVFISKATQISFHGEISLTKAFQEKLGFSSGRPYGAKFCREELRKTFPYIRKVTFQIFCDSTLGFSDEVVNSAIQKAVLASEVTVGQIHLPKIAGAEILTYTKGGKYPLRKNKVSIIRREISVGSSYLDELGYPIEVSPPLSPPFFSLII